MTKILSKITDRNFRLQMYRAGRGFQLQLQQKEVLQSSSSLLSALTSTALLYPHLYVECLTNAYTVHKDTKPINLGLETNACNSF